MSRRIRNLDDLFSPFIDAAVRGATEAVREAFERPHLDEPSLPPGLRALGVHYLGAEGDVAAAEALNRHAANGGSLPPHVVMLAQLAVRQGARLVVPVDGRESFVATLWPVDGVDDATCALLTTCRFRRVVSASPWIEWSWWL